MRGAVAGLLVVCAAAWLFAAPAAATERTRVLFTPFPGGTSHIFLMAAIAVQADQEGFQSTLYVAEMDEKWARARTEGSGVEVLTYKATLDRAGFDVLVQNMVDTDPLSAIMLALDYTYKTCKLLYDNPEAHKIFARTEVLVNDITFMCALVMQKATNVTYRVDFAPTGVADPYSTQHWGLSNPLAYVPQVGTLLSNRMNFGDRLKNVIQYWILQALGFKMDGLFAEMSRGLLGTPMDLPSTYRAANLIMYPVDWATEFPRPISPITKYIGPILPQEGSPLPADLEEFLNSAGEEGVTVVSLGTLVTMSQSKVDELAVALASLRTKVLWAHRGYTPANLDPKIRVSSWLPLNDILAHPQTAVFVTHGGMNSVMEASFHGVPQVCLPQFGDQFENCIKVTAQKRGVTLMHADVSAKSLAAAIETVLSDSEYRANAQEVSANMRTRSSTPREEAVHWIRFVLATRGAEFLRLPAADMATYQVYNIDVYGSLLLVLYIVVKLVLWLARKICCRAQKPKAQQDSKKNN